MYGQVRRPTLTNTPTHNAGRKAVTSLTRSARRLNTTTTAETEPTMPSDPALMTTLGIDEFAALAADIEPFTGPDQRDHPATAQRIEAICGRYGLVFTDASTQETQCR